MGTQSLTAAVAAEMSEPLEQIGDSDLVANYVCGFTGVRLDVVRRILEAQARYEGALGLIPRRDFAEDPRVLASKHLDLFPHGLNADVLVIELEAEWICRLTDVDPAIIARVLVGELQYGALTCSWTEQHSTRLGRALWAWVSKRSGLHRSALEEGGNGGNETEHPKFNDVGSCEDNVRAACCSGPKGRSSLPALRSCS
jgi:hypothetical protein